MQCIYICLHTFHIGLCIHHGCVCMCNKNRMEANGEMCHVMLDMLLAVLKRLFNSSAFSHPMALYRVFFPSSSLSLSPIHVSSCVWLECICIWCFLIGFSLTQFMLTEWHDTRSDRRIKQWGETVNLIVKLWLPLSLFFALSVNSFRHGFAHKMYTFYQRMRHVHSSIVHF